MSIHRESNTFGWWTAISALSAVAVLCPGLAMAEGETLETVLAVWRKREAATKSVKIVMTEDHLTGKGTLIGGPPNDLVTAMRRVVIIDGTNMRHEYVGEVWSGDIGALDFMTMYAVNNGQRSKQLFKTTRNDDHLHSVGYIEDRQRHLDVPSAYLSPVYWHFRPLSPAFAAFNLDTLKVVSTRELVDGVRCVLIEEPQKDKMSVRKYWVAPEKEMAVIRFVQMRGDTVIRQADIVFKSDPKRGWMPAEWKTIAFKNDGNTGSSSKIVVTESDLNFPVPPVTFDIVFPQGAEVFDRVLKKRYVVKPDGSHRQIMQREVERGATYSQLMTSDTGFAVQKTSASRLVEWGRIVIAVSVVIIVAGMLVVFVSRRRLSVG